MKIYKYINVRKDEQFRISMNKSVFFSKTIEYIEPGKNVKSGYFIKKSRSLSFFELF